MPSFELSRPLFVNSFRHIDSDNCEIGWVSSNRALSSDSKIFKIE